MRSGVVRTSRGDSQNFSGILSPMRVVTFDIETANWLSEVSGMSDLEIAIVCIHDSETDSYASYLESELPKLWPILEQADALVTWNGDHFDIPLLDKYYPGDLTKIKSVDMMREVVKVLGRRLKLDTIAEATLGVKKSGNGVEAVEWWRSGEIDKIIKYCIDDVKITRQVYDYALANKCLKYREMGVVKEIKLDTSSWEVAEPHVMTYTLPF